MPLDNHQYLAAIAADSAALADAVTTASLDTPVPSCPDWTAADLVAHAGSVQRWAAGIVSTVAQERPERDPPPSFSSMNEAAQWFREGSAMLIAALDSADPDAPMWTFSFDRRVGFWFRRQAQEVSVHRWDAESLAGTPQPLDATVAADGIDEWLAMVAAFGAGGLPEGEGESTVHLHCTDVDGEWLVRRSPDGLDIERAHAKGDVAARGTASDLHLYLWGRVTADLLEIFGDAELLESLRAAGAR